MVHEGTLILAADDFYRVLAEGLCGTVLHSRYSPDDGDGETVSVSRIKKVDKSFEVAYAIETD